MTVLSIELDARATLPVDSERATLVGRAWLPGPVPGPTPVAVLEHRVFDLGALSPTVSALLDLDDPVAAVRRAVADGSAVALGSVDELLARTPSAQRDPAHPWLAAPPDLQALKACGVTFVSSMLERVIEEQAQGDPDRAESVRASLGADIGASLSAIRPGSPEAAKVKEKLLAQGMWSQYLEVGIGPDAEVFTKSQPLSAVGTGADIGIHPASHWNNPEPELVLAISSRGRVVGASLGNDVNLRDFEGRSALLLGRGKDNNGSCAIGPFIRLLDDGFGIDDLRRLEISVTVRGEDGFALDGRSDLSKISRDPLDLVAQSINRHHQYPDGLMLFLGTMFAPTQDRGEPGQGFTHKRGDVVTISAPALGTLVNRVDHTDRIAPWAYGAGALMRTLAARGRLRG
jgi:fumarylacetoacetate (FAA) hydrolase family protein